MKDSGGTRDAFAWGLTVGGVLYHVLRASTMSIPSGAVT